MNFNYLDLQTSLLNKVKDVTNGKLVDVLIDDLHLSSDSAYRRIRNEKILTLDEIATLCHKYNISFDELITQNKSSSVLFSFEFPDSNFDFRFYLENALENLKKVKENNGTLYYSAKDIPIFHVFQSKKLTAFKVYYWMRTMSNKDNLTQMPFSFDLLPNEFYSLTNALYLAYTEVDSHEIWNYETIHSSSAQIQYYYDAGLINLNQAKELLEELNVVLDHLKSQAENQEKFHPENGPSGKKNYHFYYNEIIAADNSIFAEFGNKQEAFKPHIVLNFMTTQNPRYCEYVKSIFDNVIQKSTLISGVNEKDRNLFFRYNFKRIEKTILRLEDDF